MARIMPWKRAAVTPPALSEDEQRLLVERAPPQRVGVIVSDPFDLAREMFELMRPFPLDQRALALKWAGEMLALTDREPQP